jgi:hypothetical protein
MNELYCKYNKIISVLHCWYKIRLLFWQTWRTSVLKIEIWKRSHVLMTLSWLLFKFSTVEAIFLQKLNLVQGQGESKHSATAVLKCPLKISHNLCQLYVIINSIGSLGSSSISITKWFWKENFRGFEFAKL